MIIFAIDLPPAKYKDNNNMCCLKEREVPTVLQLTAGALVRYCIVVLHHNDMKLAAADWLFFVVTVAVGSLSIFNFNQP